MRIEAGVAPEQEDEATTGQLLIMAIGIIAIVSIFLFLLPLR
jgi:hypothetical protein